jgi:hypothetical protein
MATKYRLLLVVEYGSLDALAKAQAERIIRYGTTGPCRVVAFEDGAERPLTKAEDDVLADTLSQHL